MQSIDKEQLERVSRIYKSNQDACRALGISLGGFGRACRAHGIDTPYIRKRKRRKKQD